MPTSQVVITGIGVVSPLGLGREAFWKSILEARCGIVSLADRTDGDVVPPPGTCPEGLQIGGAVTDFEPVQWVRPRKALKVMCREVQTAFAAAQMAIDDAGLGRWLPAVPQGPIRPDRIGTVFGSEMFYGPPQEMVDAFRDCVRLDASVDASRFGTAAIRGIMPLWMLKYLPNMPACHVGIAVNAHGPNNTLVQGDVSGPAALIEAVSCIRRNLADVIITGAVGTRINATRLNYRGDSPVSRTIDPIAASCRPHDPQSSGVIGGEGAGSLTLESAEAATQRGARVLAEVVGAVSRFIPSPAFRKPKPSTRSEMRPTRGSAQAVSAAIDAVLEQSGVAAKQVGLIVGHAMGDPAMDAAELRGLAHRFPMTPNTAPIASLGHCGAASGMLELITAVAALVARTVPATVNARTAVAAANLRDKPAELQGDHVLCVTHTSEGSCTAVLLRGV